MEARLGNDDELGVAVEDVVEVDGDTDWPSDTIEVLLARGTNMEPPLGLLLSCPAAMSTWVFAGTLVIELERLLDLDDSGSDTSSEIVMVSTCQ